MHVDLVRKPGTTAYRQVPMVDFVDEHCGVDP